MESLRRTLDVMSQLSHGFCKSAACNLGAKLSREAYIGGFTVSNSKQTATGFRYRMEAFAEAKFISGCTTYKPSEMCCTVFEEGPPAVQNYKVKACLAVLPRREHRKTSGCSLALLAYGSGVGGFVLNYMAQIQLRHMTYR